MRTAIIKRGLHHCGRLSSVAPAPDCSSWAAPCVSAPDALQHAVVMTRQALLRSFRSFLDRLYVLQRFKLFIGSRACPPSTPVQPQQLRLQIVALVQKYAASDACASFANAPQWKLDVGRSLIANAGDGVFLRGAGAAAGTLLTLYPGDHSLTSTPCTHCHFRELT